MSVLVITSTTRIGG